MRVVAHVCLSVLLCSVFLFCSVFLLCSVFLFCESAEMRGRSTAGFPTYAGNKKLR